MSERKVSFAHGEFYHLYNRGNSKQVIFKDGGDYQRFQQMLFAMNAVEGVTFRLIEREKMYKYDRGDLLVAIGAYCLMPNHFHILLTPLKEGGIQSFMQKLSTGYSMYFNKKYERTGGLFEGRFRAQHANSDEYLKYLFSYIHLNPLKLLQSNWKELGLKNVEGGKKYLDEYLFSSYPDFIEGNRPETNILEVAKFPNYFPQNISFIHEIQQWMNYQTLFE
jgi:putative transposase